MRHALRKWTCRNCGRSNETTIEMDGSAKCEHCAHVMKIQPSAHRGGETAAQISRFSRSTAERR